MRDRHLSKFKLLEDWEVSHFLAFTFLKFFFYSVWTKRLQLFSAPDQLSTKNMCPYSVMCTSVYSEGKNFYAKLGKKAKYSLFDFFRLNFFRLNFFIFNKLVLYTKNVNLQAPDGEVLCSIRQKVFFFHFLKVKNYALTIFERKRTY